MYLRPLKLEDATLMLEWMHDNSIVKDLHRDFSKLTLEDCERFITASLIDESADLHLAISSDSDEYLGTVSLKHIDNENGTAEFGIVVRSVAMGTGVSRDAMATMFAFAFKERNIGHIYWCVSPDNTRALRFYDKNAYRRIQLSEDREMYDRVMSLGTYLKEEVDRYVWYLISSPSSLKDYSKDASSNVISTSENPIQDLPDVSVYMMTYFHERYVRQAIDSVIAQKTHYRFELVISDDCSRDGTVEILREYERNYPNLIRVNVNDHNLGIPANIFKARIMCRGRYITNLSGDDYWIDDSKLETEVAFLDTHPEYSAVACRIELRMNDSQTAYDTVPSETNRLNRAYTIKDYEKCVPLGTHGLVMRNYFLTEEGRAYFAQAREISEFVDDAVDEVLLLRRGPIYVMDITSDAHRVVPVSADKYNYNSRYSRLEKFKHHIDLLNGMSSRWSDEIDFSNWYANYTATGILGMLTSLNIKSYCEVFATIPKRYKRHLRWIPFAIKLILSRFRR